MKSLKFCAGIILFLLSFLVPLAGFWIAKLDLPVEIKGTVIALLTVGGPEVLAILAVALLGKETFDLISKKLLTHLGRLAPRGSVSEKRYHMGITLFMLSFLAPWLMEYAPLFIEELRPLSLPIAIGSDLIFIASLFILGGDFWDKLRSLFVYDAFAVFPKASQSAAAVEERKESSN
ncbi:MAG: transporter suffix domain-containing protein [Candidatus Obscuribacterales bacterium]|nr:transporter suffix domain-containing protein [Candidatus Obscuribacterales bacterium]